MAGVRNFNLVAIFALVTILFAAMFPRALAAFAIAQNKFLADEDELNLFCLNSSYPHTFQTRKSPSGDYILLFPDGKAVPYSSIKTAMSQPYPLEPHRPPTPVGFAPGRQRSYELLDALYGTDQRQVRQRITNVPFLGKKLALTPQAAAAFARAKTELMPLNSRFHAWLIPEGAFNWRNIAGENRLSAHSYGIALDIGVKKAPYWRWSKVMPHPLQRSYPSEIVEVMEKQGFIWGGKWHEYDLMHYEYRPEIICKARMRRAMRQIQPQASNVPPRSYP